MRRLISVLAAGLLAAGTVLTAGSAASAGPAAARQKACPFTGNGFWSVTAHSVSYYLGTPNNLSSGAAAILKPKKNSTTQWTAQFFVHCAFVVLTNRGLALTSRASSPGADVTVEPVGNGGNGFASQRWAIDPLGIPSFEAAFQGKTGLFLRVRNSGPVMYQTVTTGRGIFWTHGHP